MMRDGATFVALLGLALLSTVAYQIWGTGIVTTRAQAHLRAELRRGFPENPVPGHAAGVVRIPKLALDMAFVEGVDGDALAKGPGHYPNTPWPGAAGNVAIAGHRTTHAAPFWSLDKLQMGDLIYLQTRAGTFTYRIMWSGVGPPGSTWVLASTQDRTLTLTTCNPRFRSTERMVVRALQIYGPGSPPVSHGQAEGILSGEAV